ncbi:acetyl-CoA carboxylase biotin carboxylase subunit family protein [Streptomyces sp. NL15-2K]|uniref:ATP-grasp domain-containing protein n=1 Tax=Streptomyces sp. NL15-2K TaxID=376149 RepID=UPI000F56D599|nr:MULTISPECIES: ATP-grasp domain-containing protein [Actinomycetes]WKX06064.1 ATP-grasp domain-containing protein [Kutzneria buriramensis]GCB52715.1 argininosuccinate lyase [Streptomyces sp. NL15-2K]
MHATPKTSTTTHTTDTTDTPRKQAFVLLELLNHMVLIAREAKNRGFHVIALNHDPLLTDGPFAVPEGVVDEVVPVASWADAEAVDGIVDDVLTRYDVIGTYAAFEGALRHEARLRERSGLPTSGATTVTRALDKALVRGTLYREGLTTLRSTTLTEALTWDDWRFDRAAVLKPANGTGSALCFTVASLGELRAATAEIAAVKVTNALMKQYILAHGEFVLEERAEGELLSVESLVHRGEVHVVGLTGRYVSALDPVVELGACFPYPHPRGEEIVARAVEFHRALGITHGPTHLEVMVPDEGPIELIDFNLRTIGAGMSVCIGNAFGIEYAVPLTDLACGRCPDLSFLARAPRHSADLLLLPPPGATVMTDLAFPEGTEYGRVTKPFGQPLSGRADQLDVVAMVVVNADTPEELHRRALEARKTTVFNGEPLGDNPNNQVVSPRSYQFTATPA